MSSELNPLRRDRDLEAGEFRSVRSEADAAIASQPRRTWLAHVGLIFATACFMIALIRSPALKSASANPELAMEVSRQLTASADSVGARGLNRPSVSPVSSPT
jgi:hypothetical protein